MADSIDRQVAIGALRKKSQVAFDTLTTEEVSIITQSDAEKVIAEIPPAQQWIPVSSGKMPKTGEKVMVTCEHKFCGEPYRYICKAYHVDRFTMESDGNWDEGCDEYHEEDDTFYVLEGWYEVIHNWDDYGSVSIEDTVVAYMPLPEPWKGET